MSLSQASVYTFLARKYAPPPSQIRAAQVCPHFMPYEAAEGSKKKLQTAPLRIYILCVDVCERRVFDVFM